MFQIHGGTTEADIVGRIKKAEKLAIANQAAAEAYAKKHESDQVSQVD